MVMTSFHFDPLLKIKPNGETSDFLLIAVWHRFLFYRPTRGAKRDENLNLISKAPLSTERYTF